MCRPGKKTWLCVPSSYQCDVGTTIVQVEKAEVQTGTAIPCQSQENMEILKQRNLKGKIKQIDNTLK